MYITILGRSTPDAEADQAAFLLGQILSALGHKLSVGGSKTGVSEAVRQGAAAAPKRHVRTYYVRTFDPIIKANRSDTNGYFFFEQQEVLDRFGLVSNASVVIFLGLCRANVGTAINLLYEQHVSTSKNIDADTPERLLLFFEPAIPCVSLGDVRQLFGAFMDKEDMRELRTFRSIQKVLASIEAWADRPKLLA